MKHELVPDPPLGWLSPYLTRFVLHLTSRFRIQQEVPLPPPPYIIISNHLSYFDAATAIASGPNAPVFTAEKYRHGHIVGRLMSLFARPLWVEQNSPDRAALKTALALFKAGIPVGIAPEGTRSRNGQLGPGLEGAAFLIRKANVPIVPCAFEGTEMILKKLRPRVVYHIGRTFRLPESIGGKEGLREDTERLMCSIAALLPERYHGVYAGHPLIKEMAQIVR